MLHNSMMQTLGAKSKTIPIKQAPNSASMGGNNLHHQFAAHNNNQHNNSMPTQQQLFAKKQQPQLQQYSSVPSSSHLNKMQLQQMQQQQQIQRQQQIQQQQVQPLANPQMSQKNIQLLAQKIVEASATREKVRYSAFEIYILTTIE